MYNEFEGIEDELEEILNADDEDNRPPMRPRKHPQLWQSYLLWNELMLMRQRHTLRIEAVEDGRSNLDVELEKAFIEEFGMDANLKLAAKQMANFGKSVGPVWDWITSIKGLKQGPQAAKLLAQIDDIERFDTVAKLWRFAGWAVIDGKAERNKAGEKSHYNRKLKSICYIIGDLFIKANTPYYRDIYDAEKARQQGLHPEPVTIDGKKYFTKGHIHSRAMRKMIKVFLKDLWLEWRKLEGLPVTESFTESEAQ